jgi:hypothetical protein
MRLQGIRNTKLHLFIIGKNIEPILHFIVLKFCHLTEQILSLFVNVLLIIMTGYFYKSQIIFQIRNSKRILEYLVL